MIRIPSEQPVHSISHCATPFDHNCSASNATEQPLRRPGPPPQPRDTWNVTYYPKGEDAAALHRPWYIIDAQGQVLGRLATLAATTLRGKTSPAYTPSMDMGGYVVIINAEKVAVTGKKELDKTYFRHSVGRPGHYKVEALRDLRKVCWSLHEEREKGET